MSKSTDDLSSTCPLCYQDIKIYAIGECDHTICHVCSTRMRALCKQMYCPVCRADLHQVVFMNKYHLHRGIITSRFSRDRDAKISFQNTRHRLEYNKLLQHQCAICINRITDGNFKMLQIHMRKEHELFYCDLCVDHLKIFTSERKSYTRKDLAQHRRKGDEDDTSYKGHPLCEFCDKRYFDKDELLVHLRRDHYFCHFCEHAGISNQFYNDYPSMKDHFKGSHFLCEEEDCEFEQFSHAFASDIDLKAHRAAAHSKGFSKFQARQNRQIDVEINLPPRTRDRRGGGGGGRHGVGKGRAHLLRDDENDDTLRAIQASMQSARAAEEEQQRGRGEAKDEAAGDQSRNSPDEEPDDAPEPMDVRCSRYVRMDDESYKPGRAHPKEQPKTSEKGPREERDPAVDIPKGDRDFPKLFDRQEAGQSSPPVANWGKPAIKTEDFPDLTPAPAAAVSLPPKAPQSSSNWRPKQTGSLSEYPVLGGGKVEATAGPKGTKTAAPPPQRVQSSVPDPRSGPHQPRASKPAAPVAPLPQRGSIPAPVVHAATAPEEFPSLSSIATLLNRNGAKSNRQKQAAQTQSESKRSVGGAGGGGGRGVAPSKKKKEPKVSKPLAKARTEEQRSFRPPPGFGSQPSGVTPGPPPGFGSVPGNSVPSTQPPSSYVQPVDYKDRNRELVQRIRKYLKDKEGGFDQFRTLSGQFRTDLISARDYYDQCLALLGDNFKKIFEELVSLLPDVDKQQQLQRVQGEMAGSQKCPGDAGVLKISRSNSPAPWRDQTPSKHKTCPHCRQVVLGKDFEEHLNTHQDFPALTSSAPAKDKPGFTRQSAWGRMK